MIMSALSTFLIIIALIICLIYGIQLIMIAFKESTAWGLMYLFVPFANFVFIVRYWESCKSPFLRALLAIPCFILAMMILPSEQSYSEDSIEYITSTDSNCLILNPDPEEGETATWSGACEDGYADGKGMVKWYHGDELVETDTGLYIEGSLYGIATVDAHGKYAYKGNIDNYEWSGYGELIYVPGNPTIQEWKKEGVGGYVGKNYVVKGLFIDSYLDMECEKSKCPK